MSRAGSRSQSDAPTQTLAEALSALVVELGIPFDEMLHTVEGALAVAYKRAFNPDGDVTVKLDIATGALGVRSRVVHPNGSVEVKELPSEDFRRMAAQTAKHAVLRHLHDLERDKVLRDVAEHKGELATGIVDRIEAGTVYVDLGRAEGVMPPEEQIPGEQLIPGRPVLVVMLDTQHNRKQAQVRVSRAARTFVHRLLEAEVPEIKAGTVQVRAIAREPGLRTKVAVSSPRPSGRRRRTGSPSTGSPARPRSWYPKTSFPWRSAATARTPGLPPSSQACASTSRPARPMKRRHRPVRTCVACRQEAGKAELIRLVRRPDGQIELDLTGRMAGRGAYLHAAAECVEAARKRRALERALGAPVPPQVWAEVSNSLSPA